MVVRDLGGWGANAHDGGGGAGTWGAKGAGGAEPQWVRDAYARGRLGV